MTGRLSVLKTFWAIASQSKSSSNTPDTVDDDVVDADNLDVDCVSEIIDVVVFDLLLSVGENAVVVVVVVVDVLNVKKSDRKNKAIAIEFDSIFMIIVH